MEGFDTFNRPAQPEGPNPSCKSFLTSLIFAFNIEFDPFKGPRPLSYPFHLFLVRFFPNISPCTLTLQPSQISVVYICSQNVSDPFQHPRPIPKNPLLFRASISQTALWDPHVQSETRVKIPRLFWHSVPKTLKPSVKCPCLTCLFSLVSLEPSVS